MGQGHLCSASVGVQASQRLAKAFGKTGVGGPGYAGTKDVSRRAHRAPEVTRERQWIGVPGYEGSTPRTTHFQAGKSAPGAMTGPNRGHRLPTPISGQ